ncbi:MAG: phospholipase C, phosphocholine-specific [Chitinophagaceae bacterium]
MDTRRDFIKKAALLSGSAGLASVIPESVLKAMAINPATGTTYLDAEHIVILMQENRSFDHTYGALQGVRGFNDPRAIIKEDKNLVWLQKNAAGETYAPFRLNIRETNATWLGSLPHSWTNQVDAHNGGKHDKWLIAKPSGHKGFAKVPLTMGYYNREDIPFYYSLADAFTVCDQNFCSSLTGTTPNRLYLWTGTVRPKPSADSFAHLRNEDVDHFIPASWPTFPERLEEHNISWKIYQNELSLASGFNGDEDAWLSNFTDNSIEFFSQYNVQYAASYRNYIKKAITMLPPAIDALKEKLKTVTPGTVEFKKIQDELDEKQVWLTRAKEGVDKYTVENFDKLSQREKNIHEKAFSINSNDPFYRQLDTLHYTDDGTTREMKVPKGDVLHQFRQDVDNGKLPTVSWIVSPENFSDHPGAPWYGAWYVSEVMDILTKKPEVWKKTIFILCYDENDGYFDHVPPFVAPDPANRNSGLVSSNIDASLEYVTLEQDMKKYDKTHSRQSSIGLGYRVPLVIASPWSRGGAVCSQVFDHTSIIRFIEKFVSTKFNKKLEESNITQWRRTVCGDLTSVFKPYNGEKINKPLLVAKDNFLESIHNARFKRDPSGYKVLSEEEIVNINKSAGAGGVMPVQEKGIRPACAVPYQLYADGQLSTDKKTVAIKFTAGSEIFAAKSAGSPFYVYANTGNDLKVRSYAVSAGDSLTDSWTLDDFAGNNYHLSLYGPNGFFREFKGGIKDPQVTINIEYSRLKTDKKKLTGNIEIIAVNNSTGQLNTIVITDNAYKSGNHTLTPGTNSKQANLILDLSKSFGWYDFTVKVKGNNTFEKRYAGHVETGNSSFTDPFMGGIV